MDEIRLTQAREISKLILHETDFDDMEFFRDGVFKRESSGVISYPGQRDHSSHTLYNWLLGWYVYDNQIEIKSEIHKHIIDRRKWKDQEYNEDTYFNHIWPFTSLLHDIGYMFEGSLLFKDPDTHSSQAEIGLKIVKDYFDSKFWIECGLSSNHERALLKKLIDKTPSFDYGMSLAGLADAMSDLGNLDHLTESVTKEWKARISGEDFPRSYFPGDAFDLWAAHYQMYGTQMMVDRINKLRESFHELIYKGIPKVGQRVLDHGVCGGLLLLMVSTHYHKIRFTIDQVDENHLDEETKRVIKKFKDRHVTFKYDSLYWWTGVVWATMSVAIHNLQQTSAYRELLTEQRLSLDDDPLSYLGILVDILQEFDRYHVFPITDKPPLQNSCVRLSSNSGKIVIEYPKLWAKKVKDDLDYALSDWTKFVEVKPI
jgi:hypothetical protein